MRKAQAEARAREIEDQQALSKTTVSRDEWSMLNAIAYGQDEPGICAPHLEALIPTLIRRGLVSEHRVWRLTTAGAKVVRDE